MTSDDTQPPRSKRFSRLSQAHLAIGIKDEDKEESEIDKRLGLSHKQESSLTKENVSMKTRSNITYAPLKVRPDAISVRLKSLPETSTVPLKALSEISNVSMKTLSDTSNIPLEALSEVSLDALPGTPPMRTGTQAAQTVPPKPPRKNSIKKDNVINAVETAKLQQNSLITYKKSTYDKKDSMWIKGEEKRDEMKEEVKRKDSKRKRHTGSQILRGPIRQVISTPDKSTRVGEDISRDLSIRGSYRIKNRLSTLVQSMSSNKAPRQRSSTSESEQNTVSSSGDTTASNSAKTLRMLEEETCNDVAKLLQDRVKELRKVKDPNKVQLAEDVREDFPLFEFVCEVSLRRKSEGFTPYMSWSHPPLCIIQEEEELLASVNSIPMFCFPDLDVVKQVKKLKTETYCFVFTDLQAQNKFGYCRRFLPNSDNPEEKRFPVVYCMVARLRSFETFSKVFDQVVELRNHSSAGAYSFLKALIEQGAPKPGKTITVRYINAKIGNMADIEVTRVTAGRRFEHVDLFYVFQKLGTKLLVEIFINLLVERKLLFVADCLSDLTVIIHSIMQLLHPLQWQGIYIPVLPVDIIDATMSPVPFVIGILNQHTRLMDEEALDDECNVVYISEKKIVKKPNFTDIPFNKKIRKRFLQELKALKTTKRQESKLTDDVIMTYNTEIGAMFFRLVKSLIGHYEDNITFEDEKICTIDKVKFSNGAGPHCEFVWHMSKTQMFSSFIQALTPHSKNPFQCEDVPP